MIDVTTESMIGLAAAAKLVPPGRRHRPAHLSTILRWIRAGAKAPDGTTVRLEAVRLGGRWVTSKEALQRFGERLTPDLGGAGERPAPRTAGRRRKASERAEKELAKLGI